MIKKQQKWIALFVALTFIWLMQVSTMPAAAAGTTEQVSSAGAEQGPDYFESVSHKAAPAKKKSALPFILIGVGLVAVTVAVLFLFVLKGYDITGEWTLLRTRSGSSSSTRYLTFTGDKKAGSTRIDFDTWGSVNPDLGIYTVDGKAVNFTQYWTSNPNQYEYNYVGNFTAKDTMSGTYSMSKGTPESGTWTATRSATSATVHRVAAPDSQRDSLHRQQY